MPRKAKAVSKEAAETEVWNAVVDGSSEDLRKLRESDDKNITEAFHNLGGRLAGLVDSQEAWARRQMNRATRTEIGGTIDVGLEILGKGDTAFKYGKKVVNIGRTILGRFGG